MLFIVPLILPLAERWVTQQEAIILKNGSKLNPTQEADARRVGVKDVEKVRIFLVDEVPLPTHPILIWLGRKVGLLSRGVAGITLGHGIYIRSDCALDRGLWTHEFVHVAQYERLGSIRAFLSAYLKECLEVGYPHGPLEREAVMKSK